MHPDDVLLNANDTRARVGGVSTMCIWRWQRDSHVMFPLPDATINGRNYWRASTVRAWQERMTLQPKPARAPPPTHGTEQDA